MQVQHGDRVIYLVRGQFDDGDFAVCTGQGSVTHNGIVYVGGAGILAVSGSAMTTGDRLSGLQVTISGLDPSAISIAEAEPFQRRRVVILLARAADNGAILETTVFFDGLADNLADNNDPERPEISMTLEPRALDLQRARPFRYLPEDQKRRFAGDAIFDMVQDIQTKELQLGS